MNNIPRHLLGELQLRLQDQAAVALLGPRQVGKTSLAHQIAKIIPSVYRDLENSNHLLQVEDIHLFVQQHPNQLIILDEVQRLPTLFPALRGIIDQRRRDGKRTQQFLLLGSAGMTLVNKSSESLAGRLSFLELAGIQLTELQAVPSGNSTLDETRLWSRGGFPDSLLARTDSVSMQWRQDYIRSYVERDLVQLGFNLSSPVLGNLLRMLAYQQGGIFNASMMANNLDVSAQTVKRYLDVLEASLLVRRLLPWHNKGRKRLVKSAKIYIRDSGILHALLELNHQEAVLSHPVVGHSWEGYMIESIAAMTKHGLYFYRTQAGAEIDVLLTKAGQPYIGIEIKRSSKPQVSKGFRQACDDLHLQRRYVIYPGDDSYRLPNNIQVISSKQLSLIGTLNDQLLQFPS